LSDAYLKKGPIDSEESIVESLNGTPVMVMDAQNDDRIQYPEAAKAEGIASILSVPMSVRDKIIGVLRIYASEPKEFSPSFNQYSPTRVSQPFSSFSFSILL
jgi:GAF domain-containing protein